MEVVQRKGEPHASSFLYSVLLGVILTLQNIIMWIVVYPGYLQADHQNTIAGIATGQLSEWHSLLWGYFAYPFLYLSPSYGVYGIVQIAIFVASILYSIIKLESMEFIGRRSGVVLAFIFALCPTFLLYNQLYSSDIVFACLLAPLTVCLIQVVVSKGNILKRVNFDVFLGVLLYLICELRKNAILILVLAFVLLMVWYHKNHWIRILILFASTGVLVCATNFCFSYVLGADPSPSQELSSVPSMQIARVYKDGGEIPDDINARMSQIRSPQQWSKGYLGYNADPEKQGIRLNPQFIGDWIVLGTKNPRSYISAYIALMNPYWQISSPAPSYITTDFSDHGDFTQAVCKADGCRQSYLDQFSEGLSSHQQHVGESVEWIQKHQYPVVTDLYNLVFFNRALPLWIFIVGLCLCFYAQRAKEFLLVSLPLWSVLISLLAFSPATQFRYSVQMFYVLPLLITVLWHFVRARNSEKRKSVADQKISNATQVKEINPTESRPVSE